MSLKHNCVIDYLKVVYAFLIITVHYQSVYSMGGYFKRGAIGVEFFYILFGFAMAAKSTQIEYTDLADETLKNLKERAVRILYPYIMCWTISFLCYNILNQSTLHEWGTSLLLGIPELLLLHSTGMQMMCFLKQTWFISALFMTLIIVYPLLLKFKKTYIYIVSPFLSAIILGYVSKKHGYILWDVDAMVGFVTKGFLRAFAEINLGIFVFGIINKLCGHRVSRFYKIILGIVSILSTVIILAWASLPSVGNSFDFTMVILSAISIGAIFALSQTSHFLNENVVSKFCHWLSVYMYLTHRIILDYLMPGINLNSYVCYIVYVCSIVIMSILLKSVGLLLCQKESA